MKQHEILTRNNFERWVEGAIYMKPQANQSSVTASCSMCNEKSEILRSISLPESFSIILYGMNSIYTHMCAYNIYTYIYMYVCSIRIYMYIMCASACLAALQWETMCRTCSPWTGLDHRRGGPGVSHDTLRFHQTWLAGKSPN